jgi:anti-anti-sigma regulatory factor
MSTTWQREPSGSLCALQAGIDEGATAIIVDLSDVSFIDASGLGVIVLAARH